MQDFFPTVAFAVALGLQSQCHLGSWWCWPYSSSTPAHRGILAQQKVSNGKISENIVKVKVVWQVILMHSVRNHVLFGHICYSQTLYSVHGTIWHEWFAKVGEEVTISYLSDEEPAVLFGWLHGTVMSECTPWQDCLQQPKNWHPHNMGRKSNSLIGRPDKRRCSVLPYAPRLDLMLSMLSVRAHRQYGTSRFSQNSQDKQPTISFLFVLTLDWPKPSPPKRNTGWWFHI